MPAETISFTACNSPHGDMIAAWSGDGVCCLQSPESGLDELYAWVAQYARHAELVPEDEPAFGLQDQLDEYFAGRRRRFDLPLDLRGTPLQQAIWRAVLAIPYGETRSYADIARAVGRPAAWRAVAAANTICPVGLIIPCHRVIGADGTVKGSAAGVMNRTWLLELEQSTS